MKHSRTLFTPAQCLLGVFSQYTCYPIALIARTSLNPRIQSNLICKRYTSTINSRNGAGAPSGAAKALVSADGLRHLIKDEAVESQTVQVVQENGKLSPPSRLDMLLRKIERPKQIILQLSKPDPVTDMCVVRICDRETLQKAEYNKRKKAKEKQKMLKDQTPKQIELNWAISENDLSHKLTQLEGFVAKGKKVEIIIAAKRRQRKASIEEGKQLLRTLRDKLAEIDAKEVSPMEGALLSQAILTVRKKTAD